MVRRRMLCAASSFFQYVGETGGAQAWPAWAITVNFCPERDESSIPRSACDTYEFWRKLIIDRRNEFRKFFNNADATVFYADATSPARGYGEETERSFRETVFKKKMIRVLLCTEPFDHEGYARIDRNTPPRNRQCCVRCVLYSWLMSSTAFNRSSAIMRCTRTQKCGSRV